MKISVQIESDLENEVEDVIIVIEEDGEVRNCWVKGFDDVDWEEAQEYAKRLATALNVDFDDE